MSFGFVPIRRGVFRTLYVAASLRMRLTRARALARTVQSTRMLGVAPRRMQRPDSSGPSRQLSKQDFGDRNGFTDAGRAEAGGAPRLPCTANGAAPAWPKHCGTLGNVPGMYDVVDRIAAERC
jgi:hypothetical protein